MPCDRPTWLWPSALAFGALLLPLAAAAQNYVPIGLMGTRPASNIVSSSWSIGAETMDRDYTDYAKWKSHLAPLGAKRARLQSGWAKTEPSPGVYDWAWHDAIIPDMANHGVEPWVCLSYGNPAYGAEGGVATPKGPLPSGDALLAWDRFVTNIVARYGSFVDEWEIWNEPNIVSGISSAAYGVFLEHTARTVRSVQPHATIIAFALSGTSTSYVRGALDVLQANGTLDVVDLVSYHPYAYNPDSSYSGVSSLRSAVRGYAPHLDIFQGENGAPSVGGGYGALADYDWTEVSQAKWAARRLLGDLGRDIRSSYFSICDMLYDGGRNYKGLLDVAPDMTVLRKKHAYSVVQRIMGFFDEALVRLPSYPFSGASGLAVFGYAATNGAGQVVTIWKSGSTPGNSNDAKDYVTLSFADGHFADPVYVDLYDGVVYDIPDGLWSQGADGATIQRVPVYDGPVLIVERALLGTLDPVPEPPPPPPPTPTLPRTVAHWRFETPAFLADSGPNGHALTTHGASPLAASATVAFVPRIGATNLWSADFGTAQAGYLSAADGADTYAPAFTLEAFVRQHAAATDILYIASQWQYTGANRRSWGLGVCGTAAHATRRPGELILILSSDGAATATIESDLTENIQPGKDYYIAVSFDATDAVVFRLRNLSDNGPLLTEMCAHGLATLFDSSARIQIGTYDSRLERVWKGTIDELRWSREVLDESRLLISRAPPDPTVVRLAWAPR